MKRKFLYMLLMLITMFALAACFVACGGNNDGDNGDNDDKTHNCIFIHYEYNNDATCVADGSETAKCEVCDKTDTRISESFPATGIHNYVDYKYNNDATCGTDGTETGKCKACNEPNTRKSESPLATGIHDYIDYYCTICKNPSPDVHITEGLEYNPIFNVVEMGEGAQVIEYHVARIGDATDLDIVIPKYHNGKAVTGIDYCAFRDCVNITSVNS